MKIPLTIIIRTRDEFPVTPHHYSQVFANAVLRLVVSQRGEGMTMRERTILLVFLIRCFNSLEVEVIREQVQKVISLPMWSCLLPGRLQQVSMGNDYFLR